MFTLKIAQGIQARGTIFNPIMYRGWRNTAAFSTEFLILHRELAPKYTFAFYIFKTT